MSALGTDDHRCLFYLGGRCCHALAPQPTTCAYFKAVVPGATGDAAPASADGRRLS